MSRMISGAPVKFASLVFFEEFNGASRGQKSEVRGPQLNSSQLNKKQDRFHRINSAPFLRKI
jgi:hypothetical protein